MADRPRVRGWRRDLSPGTPDRTPRMGARPPHWEPTLLEPDPDPWQSRSVPPRAASVTAQPRAADGVVRSGVLDLRVRRRKPPARPTARGPAQPRRPYLLRGRGGRHSPSSASPFRWPQPLAGPRGQAMPPGRPAGPRLFGGAGARRGPRRCSRGHLVNLSPLWTPNNRTSQLKPVRGPDLPVKTGIETTQEG